MSLSENVLTCRILHITCLTGASRVEQPGSRASIQYGLPPSQRSKRPDKINEQRAAPITGLGFIAGHAVNDENDLAPQGRFIEN